MNKKSLIIYGASSYAEMVARYFQHDSEYDVVAFCVDSAYLKQNEINGIPVVTYEEIEDHFDAENHSIFAAIGYKSVRTHKALYEKVKKLPYPIVSYISSQAIIDPSSKVGANCLVLPGVILEPDTCIEENCFINSGAIVCHHSTIKAHSILAAGSLVGGLTTVGESSLIGFRATIAELLVLGEETLLAAGSVLLQPAEAHTMYAGMPAKAVRRHYDTGIVLSASPQSTHS